MGDYKPDLGMANTMDVWLTGYSFILLFNGKQGFKRNLLTD